MSTQPNRDATISEEQRGARAEEQKRATHRQADATPAAPRGSLRIRCPHCHSPIEVPGDSPLAETACPVCGSRFSLIAEETLAYEGGSARRIGQFELIEQVGVGHFGAVWKARDTELDRLVAVKIPRKWRLDMAEAEQFLREARAQAQVSHPNVVCVHEVGRTAESLYIVSDFIEGATLKEWLVAQRPMPREAVEMCVKIAEALHEAHEAGVVHRDLKPGNIMLDAVGEPHVTDFGLAKRETGDVTMTVDGRIMGTPAYMSPEQARGKAHEADRRTDVYSLGVILYELLTGELPFRGDTRMLVMQILRDEPPSLRKFNSRISRDLETVCLKCLEKDPERRYPTAKELSEDLQRYLDRQPVKARPVGPFGRMWRWYHRNPDAPMWTAGVFITICSLMLILWAIVGVGVLAIGWHTTENPGQATLEVAVLAVGMYCPLFWLGTRILNGRVYALWVAMILSFSGLILAIAGLRGWMFEVGTFGVAPVRLPLFTLLATLALLATIVTGVAICSQYCKWHYADYEGSIRDSRRRHTRSGSRV